jgi:UDP-N-acetylmuramyl pentapeptide phosphotransferase/UDP-N-acetylglucosamine-1-phosphate transferase
MDKSSLASIAIAFAAVMCALMILTIKPLLLRHMVATPNARSSHRSPTPQGAGIAVISATLAVTGVIAAFAYEAPIAFPTVLFGATLFIAAVGLTDDIRFIPVVPRLILQAVAVGAVLWAVSGAYRIIPIIPPWIEFGLLLLAGLWFVNLVNFMDGLDLMTVAEVIPVSTALVLLGCLGHLPSFATIVAAALCGAMVGFAPFNRPVAKLFLGDVGSLPIGLLLGWCLLELAHQHVIAALLLPLYYLADATVTLLRRLVSREMLWVGHRSHFYQRATDNGFSVLQVVGEVFLLNAVLASLAIGSVITSSETTKLAILLAGASAVIAVMWHFSQHRPTQV